VDELDVIVSSADLRRSKPDPRVFRWTARALGISCADCAFVDDEPRHVAAAGAVGMAAIQHRNAAVTRRRLGGLGVPGARLATAPV
jgi:HAD superfamily hydrolase (TIGR01509 family)